MAQSAVKRLGEAGRLAPFASVPLCGREGAAQRLEMIAAAGAAAKIDVCTLGRRKDALAIVAAGALVTDGILALFRKQKAARRHAAALARRHWRP